MSVEPTRWHHGEDHVLVWEGGAALLSASAATHDAERIWNAMRREASLARFLALLAETQGTGLLDLPPFAVALVSTDSAHLAVRGDFCISAVSDGRLQEFSGDGITTWLERRFESPDRIVLYNSGIGDVGLPILSGVVQGGAVDLGALPLSGVGSARNPAPAQHREAPRAPQAEADAEVPGGDLDQPHAEVADRAGVDGSVRDDDEVPAPQVVHAHGADNDARNRETRVDDDLLDEASPASLISVPKVAPASDEGRPSGAEADEVPRHARSKYDSLFGASIAVSPEVAAVREDGEPPEVDPPQAQESVSPVVAQPASSTSASEVVDMKAQSVLSAPSDPDLHDGHTIADFAELDQAADAAVDDSRGAEMIPASFCQRGHANPPHRDRCRVCEGPVEARTEITPRPALGRLRLSSGEVIDLVGPIVAGRSPTASGHHSGAVPRLVALPHPHVSGSHIEFTLEGWSVIARDLASRNGSYLRRSGQPPMRLPESAIPLANGDILDLGHGVFIYLEQLP
ncbi:MAG TPA: FHA domain-containing protein [Arachnia sp.]|nr:FHA domain-containing protein [Arachnia sp.]